MGLNIKTDEAHRLARQLAELTGENMTQAVTVALRERLARLRKQERKASVEQLLAIGRHCAAHLREPADSLDHDRLLYDERGLPR